MPEEHKGAPESQLSITRSERDKNLSDNPLHIGHFGAHRNIHWAEFYFNIIKEKYPDFI